MVSSFLNGRQLQLKLIEFAPFLLVGGDEADATPPRPLTPAWYQVIEEVTAVVHEQRRSSHSLELRLDVAGREDGVVGSEDPEDK